MSKIIKLIILESKTMLKYENVSTKIYRMLQYFFKKCFDTYKKSDENITIKQFMKKIDGKQNYYNINLRVNNDSKLF